MTDLLDLSIPVKHGDGRLGQEVRFATPYSFATCGWQGSTFTMFAHHATHIDAPNHFIEGGKAIDEAPLDRLIGPAGLIELDDHGREAAITGDTLEERGRHIRKADIAILRTFGATPRQIMAIFMVQGTVIGVVGTLIGTLLGVLAALNVSALVAWLESFAGQQVLSSDVYFISSLPSDLQWLDVALICSAALILSFLATLYPSWRAAQVQPAEALRYE